LEGHLKLVGWLFDNQAQQRQQQGSNITDTQGSIFSFLFSFL